MLYFLSSHPVDLIYIQESNLNLSSSFRIPGFSALQSHGTHSRSGIFSTDVADASGGVIIFVKRGLFFSELSTSSLSLLGPYSDYVKVNISLNDSSSLSFLNVYVSPIRSSTKDSRTNLFSFSILPSYVEAEAVDFSLFRFHRKSTAPPLLLPASASASTSLVQPKVFFHYVNDCLAIFSNHEKIKQFYQEINNIHTNIKFTYELEENGKIPFLDVFIEKRNQSFISFVYRKKTNTGLYTNWKSFIPFKYKINIIKC